MVRKWAAEKSADVRKTAQTVAQLTKSYADAAAKASTKVPRSGVVWCGVWHVGVVGCGVMCDMLVCLSVAWCVACWCGWGWCGMVCFDGSSVVCGILMWCASMSSL